MFAFKSLLTFAFQSMTLQLIVTVRTESHPFVIWAYFGAENFTSHRDWYSDLIEFGSKIDIWRTTIQIRFRPSLFKRTCPQFLKVFIKKIRTSWHFHNSFIKPKLVSTKDPLLLIVSIVLTNLVWLETFFKIVFGLNQSSTLSDLEQSSDDPFGLDFLFLWILLLEFH